MVDLFAIFFLNSPPNIRPGAIGNNMTFGFRETFNGVGLFVYKESNDYKLVVAENAGASQTTLVKLAKDFQDGVNGCIINTSTVNLANEFVIRAKLYQGQLTVTYGAKMRKSAQIPCVTDKSM